MKQVVAVVLVSSVAAGLTGGPESVATAPAAPIAAVRTPEARAFPLAGRWRYAETGGLLPRGSACGADDPAITLTGHGMTLTHGPWRQPVLTFADWRLKDNADLELVVAAGGTALLDRARLTLDLSSAGFIRLRGADAPTGGPLVARADSLAGYDRASATAEIARLAGALTLIRCPDALHPPVAMLRGATETPPPPPIDRQQPKRPPR